MANYPQYQEALDLIKAGKPEQALPLYQKAVQENIEDPDILNDRGVCFIHLGKLPLALADMNKAIELQPDYSYRYAARAYVKTAMKDYESAATDYEKAIQLDPTDAVAYNNLGLLQEQMGYAKKAQTHFERADELYGILKERGISKAEKLPEETADTKPKEEATHLSTMQSVFKSKESFREFMKFIGNGFKIK